MRWRNFWRSSDLMFLSTALNIVKRLLDKRSRSVLDMGCGKGRPMKFLNREHRFYTVGLDIYKPYLVKAKKDGTHDDYVLCDIRYAPVKEKSFDVILDIEVIEHLDKTDGAKLLRNIERLARRQIIISTHVHKCEQGVCDNNPYQKHKCLWGLGELLSFGYTVKGVGFKGMFGKDGIAYRTPLIFRRYYMFYGFLREY
ncbi:MAG: class I SAM-dependent methyltransferase [Nitrososphaeria archaeon]